VSAAHVLIAGVSTRAAAESAARAGFAVTAIDAFGDLDQHPSARVLSLARNFTARAAALMAQTVECDAVVYLSNFENHPKAITTLATGRALWGNSPETVRRVRDPLVLAEALRRRGFAAPRVYVGSGFSRTATDERLRLKPEPTSMNDKWLVKPLASGGGQRIRFWDRATSVPRGCYLQEFIDGPSGSIVFVAAGGCAAPLAVSRQLVGEPAFGAAGFEYCGNILTAAPEHKAPESSFLIAASALAQAVVAEFGLVGVNGIDFIARDGRPWAIEVNPRWSASMELVERAYGLSVFEAHASACTAGRLPEFNLVQARGSASAFGKAVMYARRDVTVGDTQTWRANGDDVRDIPHPGEHISAGRPVCTVFAAGSDAARCHDALVRRAARVYAQMDAWYA
jgi:predicted ATP-grasp superfamily ATP-dependent carboligase